MTQGLQQNNIFKNSISFEFSFFQINSSLRNSLIIYKELSQFHQIFLQKNIYKKQVLNFFSCEIETVSKFHIYSDCIIILTERQVKLNKIYLVQVCLQIH